MLGWGRDATLFCLAKLGWRVTGIDSSGEAVPEVSATASEEMLPLVAVQIDLSDYDYGQDRWAPIILAYMHSLSRADAERMLRGLKPGGILVLEAYHASVAAAGLKAVSGVPRGYSLGELENLFDGLDTLVSQQVRAPADWSNTEDGTAPLVRYADTKSKKPKRSGVR